VPLPVCAASCHWLRPRSRKRALSQSASVKGGIVGCSAMRNRSSFRRGQRTHPSDLPAMYRPGQTGRRVANCTVSCEKRLAARGMVRVRANHQVSRGGRVVRPGFAPDAQAELKI
jgi:hypothetical protein